jgi:hypothetical protein
MGWEGWIGSNNERIERNEKEQPVTDGGCSMGDGRCFARSLGCFSGLESCVLKSCVYSRLFLAPGYSLLATRYGRENHGIRGKHGKVDEVGNNERIEKDEKDEKDEKEQPGKWDQDGWDGWDRRMPRLSQAPEGRRQVATGFTPWIPCHP